jgi:hypothetical protein
MKQIVEVYFVDGTPPFKFETQEEASKQTASKIFREGFIANHDDGSITYHSPHNIKKVVVKPS